MVKMNYKFAIVIYNTEKPDLWNTGGLESVISLINISLLANIS